jgi:DeoR family transcriptional regulator, suf operon transcriptional repressor
MITARHKVLAHLNKTRTASAREISRALKMPAANVRHHLRVLVSDGRLEVASVRGRDGRGRPEKVYSLPRAVLGDNLAGLADALLAEAGVTVRMEALAERLAEGTEIASQPIAGRLNFTIEKLNQMNYHARWEAGSAGPRIIFGHCPYAAIIEKHPELCQMDKALIHEMIGQPADQIFKIGKDGSSVCVFVVGR